jgi:hypothetical protein
MGVLSWRCAVVAALVGLAGCYAPPLRDCTVSCTAPGDCVGDQLCGSDGLCAAPDIAGRCAMGPPTPDASPPRDAGTTPRDAPRGDAAMPDAPALIALRVQITGKGSVVVDGHGICSSQGPQHGDCTYDIAPHVAQTVHALPVQLDQVFGSWTSVACGGQGATCTFTPSSATAITAKFVRAGG